MRGALPREASSGRSAFGGGRRLGVHGGDVPRVGLAETFDESAPQGHQVVREGNVIAGELRLADRVGQPRVWAQAGAERVSPVEQDHLQDSVRRHPRRVGSGRYFEDL